MCWQDVQISRQTVLNSKRSSSGGGQLDDDFASDLRRIRVIFTGSVVTAGVALPILQIAASIDAINNADFWISQTLHEPFIFDASVYGSMLREKFSARLLGNGIDSVVAYAEMLLYDPQNLGNPITQAGGR